MKIMTQNELLMEYFRNNPCQDIPHPEVVDYIVAEFFKEQIPYLETPIDK